MVINLLFVICYTYKQVSEFEFNDRDASTVDVSMQSIPSEVNQNYSYLKRNFSPSSSIGNSSIKKHRPSDPATLQVLT